MKKSKSVKKQACQYSVLAPVEVMLVVVPAPCRMLFLLYCISKHGVAVRRALPAGKVVQAPLAQRDNVAFHLAL